MSRRVVLVLTGSSPDSSALLAARVRRLHDAGWDARLLCHGNGRSGDSEVDPGLGEHVEFAPVRNPRLPPSSLLRRPAALARYMAAEGPMRTFDQNVVRLTPDIIHFHSASAGRRGMKLKQALGCRVVVSLHTDGQDLAADLEPLWRGADLLVFPNADALERAVASGCPRGRAVVLPAPLVVEPAGSDGRHPRTGPLRVLSAGPLTWEQGLEHALQALRLALDMGASCQYRILGRGPHETAVAFARHQYGLEEHVQLAPKGRLEDEISLADVLLDPAVTDTAPARALLFAYEAGIPFIATARAGLGLDAGMAVPRRDPRAIADALATAARDPGLRTRMGRAARSRVGGSPTLDEHMAGLQDAYARALQG